MRPIVTITERAADKFHKLASSRTPAPAGLRISVKGGGCSGFSYELEFADQKNTFDEEVTARGVAIYIDAKSVLFLIGMEIDYEETMLKSGFQFRNPNEKGRCGCGESFRV